MNSTKRPLWLWPIIFIAFAFGALTIKSGGAVIFIDGPARVAAGNYLNFVVWFNFIGGFFYILAGLGFLLTFNHHSCNNSFSLCSVWDSHIYGWRL